MNDDPEELLNELRKERDEELTYIMSHEYGRRFIWKILTQICGLYSGNFSDDHALQAYAEGRRSVGLEIRDGLLEAVKEQFLLMEKEHV